MGDYSKYTLSISDGCLQIFISILFLVVLVACEQNTDETSLSNSDVSTIPVPIALQRAKFPSNGTISATLAVDGDTKDMNIENGVATYSSNISVGEHRFSLNMFYESEELGKIELVSASKIFDVSNNDSISFEESDYAYGHSDTDGWTNVREIEVGSDPRDSSSIPVDEDDNYEDNDNIATAYDISGIEGVFINANSTTGFGVVSFSDRIDYFKFPIEHAVTFEIEFFGDENIRITLATTENGADPVDSTGIVTLILDEFDDATKVSHVIFRATNSETGTRDFYPVIFAPDSVSSGFTGTYAMKWTLISAAN